MKIIEVSQIPDLIDPAVEYFWSCWGNESNRIFYEDCILNSLDPKNDLPKFYLGLDNNHQIIGSYALLTNDIISRQDLMPWFACLFVNEEQRKNGFGGQFLTHALKEAHTKGYHNLYLSSDLVNFYERKGWKLFGKGYNVFGEGFKVYSKATKSK